MPTITVSRCRASGLDLPAIYAAAHSRHLSVATDVTDEPSLSRR